jgi:large subunit ribosomal protein L16
MLAPAKVKWRKHQRGRMKGKATRCNSLEFGEYGMQSLQSAWIDSKQIEAARISMTRFIKRGGKVWCRIFPDKPYTRHPAESRMGKGKGTPEGWVAVVRPGTMMFEMAGVPDEAARHAIAMAAQKLPVKTKLVTLDS